MTSKNSDRFDKFIPFFGIKDDQRVRLYMGLLEDENKSNTTSNNTPRLIKIRKATDTNKVNERLLNKYFVNTLSGIDCYDVHNEWHDFGNNIEERLCGKNEESFADINGTDINGTDILNIIKTNKMYTDIIYSHLKSIYSSTNDNTIKNKVDDVVKEIKYKPDDSYDTFKEKYIKTLDEHKSEINASYYKQLYSLIDSNNLLEFKKDTLTKMKSFLETELTNIDEASLNKTLENIQGTLIHDSNDLVTQTEEHIKSNSLETGAQVYDLPRGTQNTDNRYGGLFNGNETTEDMKKRIKRGVIAANVAQTRNFQLRDHVRNSIINDTTTAEISQKCNEVIYRYGIHCALRSENGDDIATKNVVDKQKKAANKSYYERNNSIFEKHIDICLQKLHDFNTIGHVDILIQMHTSDKEYSVLKNNDNKYMNYDDSAVLRRSPNATDGNPLHNNIKKKQPIFTLKNICSGILIADPANHSRLQNSPSPPNTLDKLITQQNVNVHNIAGSYGSYGNLSILDIMKLGIKDKQEENYNIKYAEEYQADLHKPYNSLKTGDPAIDIHMDNILESNKIATPAATPAAIPAGVNHEFGSLDELKALRDSNELNKDVDGLLNYHNGITNNFTINIASNSAANKVNSRELNTPALMHHKLDNLKNLYISSIDFNEQNIKSRDELIILLKSYKKSKSSKNVINNIKRVIENKIKDLGSQIDWYDKQLRKLNINNVNNDYYNNKIEYDNYLLYIDDFKFLANYANKTVDPAPAILHAVLNDITDAAEYSTLTIERLLAEYDTITPPALALCNVVNSNTQSLLTGAAKDYYNNCKNYINYIYPNSPDILINKPNPGGGGNTAGKLFRTFLKEIVNNTVLNDAKKKVSNKTNRANAVEAYKDSEKNEAMVSVKGNMKGLTNFGILKKLSCLPNMPPDMSLDSLTIKFEKKIVVPVPNKENYFINSVILHLLRGTHNHDLLIYNNDELVDSKNKAIDSIVKKIESTCSKYSDLNKTFKDETERLIQSIINSTKKESLHTSNINIINEPNLWNGATNFQFKDSFSEIFNDVIISGNGNSSKSRKFNWNIEKFFLKSLLENVKKSALVDSNYNDSFWNNETVATNTYFRIDNDPTKLYKSDSSGNNEDVSIGSNKYNEQKKIICNGHNNNNNNHTCAEYLDKCLKPDSNGENIKACITFLEDPNFWDILVQDIQEMVPSIIINTLDKFGFNTVTSSASGYVVYEDTNSWCRKLKSSKEINEEQYKNIVGNNKLMSFLQLSIKKINSSPAILNDTIINKSANSALPITYDKYDIHHRVPLRNNNIGNLFDLIKNNSNYNNIGWQYSGFQKGGYSLNFEKTGEINKYLSQDSGNSIANKYIKRPNQTLFVMAKNQFIAELKSIGQTLDQKDVIKLDEFIKDFKTKEDKLFKIIEIFDKYLDLKKEFKYNDNKNVIDMTHIEQITNQIEKSNLKKNNAELVLIDAFTIIKNSLDDINNKIGTEMPNYIKHTTNI